MGLGKKGREEVRRKARDLERVLDRQSYGIPSHVYYASKDEIDKKRQLEKEADRLLGMYRFGDKKNKKKNKT